VLVASGVDEENTSKPIFDALPPGNKQYYLAVRGRHGSSILPEKNKQTDKRNHGLDSPQSAKLSEFPANNLGAASRVDGYAHLQRPSSIQ
jgi:hypothetical protein